MWLHTKMLSVRSLTIWAAWQQPSVLSNRKFEVCVRCVTVYRDSEGSQLCTLNPTVSSWAWLCTTASHWTSASPLVSTRSCWHRLLCHVTPTLPSAWRHSPWKTFSRLCPYVHKMWHTHEMLYWLLQPAMFQSDAFVNTWWVNQLKQTNNSF